MNKLLFAVTVMLFAISMSFAQSEKAKTRISKDIRSVLEKQVEAWNRGDLEGFMEGYWKSEKMIFLSGQNMSRGWQKALDRYKRGYDTREKMGTLSFSELEIDVLSKRSAVVIGRFTLERKNDKPTGMFTLTFKKISGNWKIIVDHTS